MTRSQNGLFPMVLAGMVASAPLCTLARIQEPAAESQSAPAARKSTKTSNPRTEEKKTEEPERVIKTPEEWRKILTPEQFMVTRMKATENAFSGKYATGHFKGTFLCSCCGARLFEARTKFDSGTGWPSFWRPISPRAIDNAWDYSEPSETRVEVSCHRCGAHLGHVFQDGPAPTGLRYCINSLSLRLDTEQAATPSATRKTIRQPASKATRKGRAASGNSLSKIPEKSPDAAPPGS